MDLSTVENNVRRNFYSDIEQMANDINRIFDYAKANNKEDSDIYKKANELEEYFKKKY